MRILLIDDDEQLMEVLASKLIGQHYAVDIAINSEMGWEFILLFNFDLIVLDWMLPDIDGVSLCQKIRNAGYKMPIMLLTARDRHHDKVTALDSGADDYVVKPFNFDELTARIRALLRRDISAPAPVLQWRNLSLDPKTHEVHYGNHLLPLTPKEHALIELFMRHPQQVFSPGAIIDNLWAGEDIPGEEAVRTHIKGLRQKLKAAGMAKDTIKTVYGVGYRLKNNQDDPNYIEQSDSSAKKKLNRTEIITQTWLNFQDLAYERLAVLEDLANALRENQASADLVSQAKIVAHKLAGSLGCFGFPQGSKIAKQLEILLENFPLPEPNINPLVELVAALKLELQRKPFEEMVRQALEKNISLLIIDRDTNFRARLATEAQKAGIKTHFATNLSQAQKQINQESIDALLCNISLPNTKGLALIQQLHQQKPNLPIITIAESAQLKDRLDIVRSGGKTILSYPVEPFTAISTVKESVQNSGAAAKVLLLDDDPQVLLSLELSLEPWGFNLTTLDTPQKFWSTLEEVTPDILILDIEMPEINGLELCQILRSDRRWRQLPILFLSVHQDEKTQYQAFNIGADDYICKPVTGSILANRILNRLRRSNFHSPLKPYSGDNSQDDQ